MYEMVFTREAQKAYERADKPLVRRLHRCFDRLCRNPYEHPSIKRLRGSLSGCFRCRVGDWRVVYKVDEQEQVVIILLIAYRSEAY